MNKYVVKLPDGKYLTAYGTETENICCAEKYKEYDEAQEVAWENDGEVEQC